METDNSGQVYIQIISPLISQCYSHVVGVAPYRCLNINIWTNRKVDDKYISCFLNVFLLYFSLLILFFKFSPDIEQVGVCILAALDPKQNSCCNHAKIKRRHLGARRPGPDVINQNRMCVAAMRLKGGSFIDVEVLR